jgi:ABC-type multidrug transport system ATPase subunit
VDRGLIDAQELDDLIRKQSTEFQPKDRPYLEVVEGPDLGKVYVLEPGQRNLVGRGNTVQVSLSDPFVSRDHCVLEVEDGRIWCEDSGSRPGTFVAEAPVSGRAELHPGSIIKVGRTGLRVTVAPGATPVNVDKDRGVRIEARALGKMVTSRDTGKKLALIDNVTMVINPGEFVVILGPSGSGKSTLMDALNGRRRANQGQVLYGGIDFYAHYDLFRTKMGYVPQRDIVHSHLPVRRALAYTARLRLPYQPPELENPFLDEILKRLGLAERAKTRIGHLSGGQIKRVSIAVELVSSPNVLFLDEATSGLDAGTERKMMGLFRQIADRGKTVVCITHNLENIGQADHVAVLCRGKLVYFGPPEDLTGHFEIPGPSDLYDRLEDRPAPEWEARYAASPLHAKYVQNRVDRARVPAPVVPAPPKGVSAWKQFWYLTMRYFETTVRDWRNLGILLGQAPLIALITAIVFKDQSLLLFLMTVAAVWFGTLNASKELVKELDIYKRERMVNLKLLPYLLSKIVVLLLVSAVQCALLIWIVHAKRPLDGSLTQHFLVLLNVATAAVMLGLLISALVNTTDKAIALVPLVLIPQIVYTVYPAVGWRMESFNKLVAQLAIMSYWAFDALRMIAVQPVAREYGADYSGAILQANLILLGFSVLQFVLTAVVMKGKDRLLVQV